MSNGCGDGACDERILGEGPSLSGRHTVFSTEGCRWVGVISVVVLSWTSLGMEVVEAFVFIE